VIGIRARPRARRRRGSPSAPTPRGRSAATAAETRDGDRRRDASLRIQLGRTAKLRHQGRWQHRHDRQDGHRRQDLQQLAARATTAGFHVVILDSLTLNLLKDEVLATNGTGKLLSSSICLSVNGRIPLVD